MGEALGIGFQCGQALNVRLNMCCFEFLRAFGARRALFDSVARASPRLSWIAPSVPDEVVPLPTCNLQPVTRNLSRQVGLPQDGEIGIGLRCHAKGWVELAGLLQIKVGFLRLVQLRMIAGQVKMYRRAIWK
jgi:hypothetical protein